MKVEDLVDWIEKDIRHHPCGATEFPVTRMTRALAAKIEDAVQLVRQPATALDVGSGKLRRYVNCLGPMRRRSLTSGQYAQVTCAPSRLSDARSVQASS